MNDQTSGRDAYIAGLEALAVALKTNPEMPLPATGGKRPIEFLFFGPDHTANRTQMARVARTLGCQWREEVRPAGGGDREWFILHGKLAGSLAVELWAYRDEVCERVVTGSRTVEDVQWRGPLAAASPGTDVDHAIAADVDEQTAREPKVDLVPWPTGLCGHPVPPGAWAAGFTRCRDDTSPEVHAQFDAAARPELPVEFDAARPEDLDDADGER
jgi:hypothetical protein